MSDFSTDPGSFRDPSGQVFYSDGELYRRINTSYRDAFEQFESSGLMDRLHSEGLLVAHDDVDRSAFLNVDAYKIIRPRRIPYISYPYEWCFSQLKDAALLTLKIQKICLQHGMTLKDASAYNVQFLGSRPLFIDTLSFETFVERPWSAYRQFCQHFLGPLALMSYTDYRLSDLLVTHIDGIPLDLVSKLLPGRTRLKLGLMTHVHMHAKSQLKHADAGRQTGSAGKASSLKISCDKAEALIDHLISVTESLQWEPAETEWGNYYADTNYVPDALTRKAEIVKAFVASVPEKCRILQDLGANDGTFGRYLAVDDRLVLCHDIDALAVEKNYLAAKSAGATNVLPLIQDLTNPSPAIGWAGVERRSFIERAQVGVSMALALIHHLAISNNVPLKELAVFFARLSPYLIIEFVPKTDSQVQRLLVSRDDIFSEYSVEGFESEFSDVFEILQKQPIENSERVLYLMKRRSRS
ncbi:MAG: class I SAM-dependent methyltransferase [Pseudomonadota bacterium]